MEGITLESLQRDAVMGALGNGVVVITGGPGTGKTTIINTIIRYFEGEGLDIRLAAPTGRAAKRMSETTGCEAQTIHRLLEVNGGSMDGEGGAVHFERNALNPLETDVLIIDEMSMVDISLMSALLDALLEGTRLVLVGDVDQLPSVGPGSVLKDIIGSGRFKVVKLTKIFRQSDESEIVTNAHAINNGEDIILNKYSKDFLFIHRETPEDIVRALCTVLREKLPGYIHCSVQEVQVLTPMRKGLVGVEQLNRVLQSYVNPDGQEEKEFFGTMYREGDKVMQIKNDYQMGWEKRNAHGFPYEKGSGVYNGDMGIIEEISTFSQEVHVRFDDDRHVSYQFSQMDELELAYAITIHKSQGSEYPAVIIPMFPGPRMLMTRNLLYTAVTRAKSCVCLIGREECFREMIRNLNEQKRYSSLGVRINEL
jgi:exodeoxyribonuclease V alpha subunit